ncbi:MAG TPA: CDP-diacylglycerol--glycerol-3-phosphate 3-phosphatidyltransferase [Candidatus Dormibacteraeota bacterium]
MNLPNLLTLSRLAAIPLLMALLLLRFRGHDQLAAALFVVASFTDTLDGQIARRRGIVSDLGKFLDPLADKLLVLSVLIVLVQEGLVAAWVVVVIFSRELLITLLRSIGASKGRVIAAAPLGKTKTVLQMAAVTLLILQRPYPILVPITGVVVAVAVVFTIISGIDYLVRFRYLLGFGDGAPGSDSPLRRLAGELGAMLTEEGLSVSVAESCTGGLLGTAFTDQPGSSAYFVGGVIAYADGVKRDQLGVPADLLARHGAVSREVAVAMAEGARNRFKSDFAVSITCIAGPDADNTAKPIGLTYVGIAAVGGATAHEYVLHGDRWSNRREAASQALKLLLEEVRVGTGRQERKPV